MVLLNIIKQLHLLFSLGGGVMKYKVSRILLIAFMIVTLISVSVSAIDYEDPGVTRHSIIKSY